MRKCATLLALVMVLLVGCDLTPASPSPTPEETEEPTATDEPTAEEPVDGDEGSPVPTVPGTLSQSASCQAAPLELPVEERIPDVTEDDHIHGPADAPITIIEYADFQ